MSFASMLRGLTDAHIEFVVIGGVAAVAHGSSRVTNDLDVCYNTSEQNLQRLASLLAEWRAYPRAVEEGLPFFMDAQQLRVQPTMTLSTREGAIDLLSDVAGVGPFANALARSVEVEALGVRFRLLDLPTLIAAKRAANRPKDRAQLPELEALLALKSLSDDGSR